MTALSRLAIAFVMSGEILVGQSLAAGTKDEATELGQSVIGLMERALAIQLPEKLPEDPRSELEEWEFEEYAEVYEDRRFQPGAGFFMTEVLRDVDRELYREIRRFWKLRPAKKLTIVPFLGARYFEEERNRNLQRMILEALDEIESDAVGVQRKNEVFERAYLEIVERSRHREDRLSVLEFGLGKPILSEAGYLRVLRLAVSNEASDDDLRVELTEVLAIGWRGHNRPAEVGEYLLRVAERDVCKRCRLAAIDLSQIQDFRKEKFLPVYLKILQEALEKDDSELELRVLWTVGIKARCVEAAGMIVRALDSKEPRVRAHAIRALEQIGDLASNTVPTDFQVIPTDYMDERIDAEPMQRLERATARWQDWWRVVGEKTWKSDGEEGFKKEVARIYSSN